MRKIQKTLFVLAATLLTCCSGGDKPEPMSQGVINPKADSFSLADTATISAHINEDSTEINRPKDYFLPPLDTVIIIDTNVVFMSDTNMKPPLTKLKAKKLLYSYFTNKGFYVDGKIPKNYFYQEDSYYYNKYGEYILDVHFEKAEFVNLNDDTLMDAIVFYRTIPPFGSSHCYGYSCKALIISNTNGFELVGIDFISEFYIIENIKQAPNKNVFIYGNDYDCANGVTNRKFKITLKTKN